MGELHHSEIICVDDDDAMRDSLDFLLGAAGFSVKNESGPPSITHPSTVSDPITPPRRPAASNSLYSIGCPPRRAFSSVHAALIPAMPPPITAILRVGVLVVSIVISAQSRAAPG